MIWGRCAETSLARLFWHIVTDGKSFCSSSMKIVETKETAPTLDEKRCHNCDAKWREAGKANRKRPKVPKSPRATTYIPTNKFRDWEDER